MKVKEIKKIQKQLKSIESKRGLIDEIHKIVRADDGGIEHSGLDWSVIALESQRHIDQSCKWLELQAEEHGDEIKCWLWVGQGRDESWKGCKRIHDLDGKKIGRLKRLGIVGEFLDDGTFHFQIHIKPLIKLARECSSDQEVRVLDEKLDKALREAQEIVDLIEG